jgi:peptidoglycan/xylan/chitin deacetylase (PgdA/CDA1 family)
MRIKIKNLIAHMLYYSGIVKLFERIYQKHRCIVLVYHRIIAPAAEDLPIQDGMYVIPAVFEQHLKYLKNHYNMLSLDKFLLTLAGNRSFGKDCHITFDDGWLDNFTNAFPLLKKHRIPATVFLSTDFIGTSEWFWPEKILYLFTQEKRSPRKKLILPESSYIFRLIYQSKSSLEKRINAAINFLKKMPPLTIESVLEELKEACGLKSFPSRRLLLNWDEVKKMGKSDITFGSHTRTHAILTSIDNKSEIKAELEESKAEIENQTGQEVKCFSFPNGNSSNQLIQLVKKCGYACSFIGDTGKIDGNADPYSLKRIGMHNDVSENLPMFACRLLFDFF